MKKTTKIIYWVSTIWLSLAMLASGVQQLLYVGGFPEIMSHLGYPIYFSPIIGTWKIVGVVALLLPRFPLVKEWAYAGFFFVMSGAAFSHILVGDDVVEIFPSLFLLIMTVASWYLRPETKKINTAI